MEKEMNINGLIAIVLRKWKFTIVMAFLFAVIFGGAKAYQSVQSIYNPENTQQEQKKHNDAMEEYLTAKTTLEKAIADEEAIIVSNEKYLNNSVLMQMDAMNHFICRINLVVDNDYVINPSLAVQSPNQLPQIITAYLNDIYSSELYTQLNNVWGRNMHTTYWNELFSVKDLGEGIICVKAMGTTEREAVLIAETVSNSINNKYKRNQALFGTHTLSKLSQATYSTSDVGLLERQQEFKKKTVALKDSVLKNRKAVVTLQEPVYSPLNWINTIKSTGKYTILGMAIGIILSVGSVFILAIIWPCVTTEAELHKVFGLHVLGILPSTKKRNVIDRWADRLDGIVDEVSFEMALDIVATNLRCELVSSNNCTKDELMQCDHRPQPCRIACVSYGAYSEMEQIVSALTNSNKLSTIQLISCQSTRVAADSIDVVASCEYTILFEKRLAARYGDIDSELLALRKRPSNNIGMVLM